MSETKHIQSEYVSDKTKARISYNTKMFDTLLMYRDELDGEFIVPGTGGKSGIPGNTDKLEKQVEEMVRDLSEKGTHHAIIKAKAFEKVLKEGEIAVNCHAIFCERIKHGNIVDKCVSSVRKREIRKGICAKEDAVQYDAGETRSFFFDPDFGHVAHDWSSFSKLGFAGTLENVIKIRDEKRNQGTLDKTAEAFFESCIIVYNAIIAYIIRFVELVSKMASCDNDEVSENMKLLSESLLSISRNRPQNFHEAVLCYDIMFYVSEIVFGTRVRTLGGIDRELIGYWKNDLENGTFSEKELRLILKHFLFRLWAMRIPYDLPFMLGGIDSDGECVVNELSFAVVEEYMKLNIHSPKIHIRVSKNTPEKFILLVLDSIRQGSSSFVFCNDDIIIESLLRQKVSLEDARVYLPIGCYEPAAGNEIACTGAGTIDLVKLTNLALFGGINVMSGYKEGIETPTDFSSFDDYLAAFKAQFMCVADKLMSGLCALEKHYYYMNPNPLLSATYNTALERGRDIYDGGAKYSNTSFQIMFLPSCVDCLCAIKTVVFDKKVCTPGELREAIKANFKGYEKLRAMLLRADKYGNGSELCEMLTKDVAKFTSSYCANKPNGRGGVFRVGCFSIDRNVLYGTRYCATSDGRLAGTPFSKNLCAAPGMDKQGITSLINSAAALDHADFANGTVLDIVLHPSAVSGAEGLIAFHSILKTYFAKGGFAMHGNIFDAELLKKAQKNPEQYKNLQVRVCGWNVFFVNLSKIEQDIFIAQAQAAAE